MKHPHWLHKIISDQEVEAVERVVRVAEEKTTGEIVPMIVRRSTGLGYLVLQIFMSLSILIFLASMVIERIWYIEHLAWYVLAATTLSWPAAALLSRVFCLQRLFTLPSDREIQVHSRAFVEFYNSGIHNTNERVGILLYLSLMERKCVVMGDEAIAKKLPPETWKGLVDKIIGGIHEGKTGEGLIAAINDCGKILAQHFPVQGANPNQLPNRLIIKE